MGAKASTTAANGNQSPSRTGFNFLREIHGVEVANDNRQRARSLSSVPDIQNSHHSNHPSTYHSNTNAYNELMNMPTGNSSVVGGSSLHYEISSTSPDTDSNSHDDNNAAAMHQAVSNALGLGRVYTATSLPSHIWSLNGFKCPVCSKLILPDDIECHIVMCLTKPRLSYNEDVLNDPKGECVICLDDLNAGDVIARLPCLCVYHKGCIDQWFEKNRSCPEHPSD
ncbi:unnamed protein product [Diamesa serratosioi]